MDETTEVMDPPEQEERNRKDYEKDHTITEIVCKHCSAAKPAVEFGRSKQTKGGYKNICRTCSNAYQRDYSRNRKRGKTTNAASADSFPSESIIDICQSNLKPHVKYKLILSLISHP